MFSPRNVRVCGCPRMIFGTRPHGHRPLFCSSVTSTPHFFPTIGAKRRRLIHRSMLGIVVDSAPRTVSLSSRSLFHSPSRISTVSLRLPSGMRALSPMLLLLSSPHNIGLSNRYSVTGSPSRTSNSCLRTRVALNSLA